MQKALTKVTFGNASPLPLRSNSNTGRVGQGRLLDWLGIRAQSTNWIHLQTGSAYDTRGKSNWLAGDAQKCHSSGAEADAFRILCLMHGKA
jgi:hypothetical protein